MSNLPTIYPNETIYSWLARAFILSGYVNDQEFYKSIFDVAKVRLHPYLNNRISQLAVRSNLSEEQLINEHTLYPLFNAFVDGTVGPRGRVTGRMQPTPPAR